MKGATIKTAALVKALQAVKPLCSSVSSLPILNTVLVAPAGKGTLKVTANNLDTQLSLEVAAEVDGLGAFCVSGSRLLAACARIAGDEMTLLLEKRTLTLSSASWRMKLFTMDPDEFPPVKAVEGEPFEVEGSALALALGAALCSVSEDETRYVLNGVLFCADGKKLKLVSTDGRRLFQATTSADAPAGLMAVVPTLAVKRLLAQSADEEVVSLLFSGEMMEASGEGWVLRTKLIDGNYPNFEQVIPPRGAKHQWRIPRAEFMEALPFVEVTEGSSTVRLVVENEGAISIETNQPDVGESKVTIEAGTDGGSLKVAFNGRFLRDVLKSFQSAELALAMADEFSPLLVEDAGALAVVMPMRIS